MKFGFGVIGLKVTVNLKTLPEFVTSRRKQLTLPCRLQEYSKFFMLMNM